MDLDFSTRFMTVDLLERIAAEFDWPDHYLFEDDLPDGVLMVFPKANLYLREGCYGEVSLEFPEERIEMGEALNLIDALTVLIPDYGISREPFSHLGLKNDTSIYSSLEKVENSVRDVYIILNEYLRNYIMGDVSWIKNYRNSEKGKIT